MSGQAQKRARRLAVAVSVAGHLAIPFVLFSSQPGFPPPQPMDEPAPMIVSLVRPPPPPPPPETSAPAGPAEPAPAAARPPPKLRPPVRVPPPQVTPLPVTPRPEAPPAPLVELSEAQVAGARTAGSGGGGGEGGGDGGTGQSCDMVRRLQRALRGDPDIQAAVARARGSGRAVLVWNGDWIRSGGEEGKGLAGLRQAIIMEVGFAPEACRAQPLNGLVLISMNDRPGGARLALGAGAWRWSDLLAARRR